MSNKFIVRELTSNDYDQICQMDDKSGNYMQQWFEEPGDEGYGFGMFDGDKLIGYCSIGGADDFDYVAKHPLYNYNSLLLSDVYILPEYRKGQNGIRLVEEAIKLKREYEPEAKSIYLSLLNDDLSNFYSKLGFEWVDDTQSYAMVYDISPEMGDIEID